MTTDMAAQSAIEESRTDRWYAASAEEVTSRIGVDPSMGLSSHEAADLLERNGPNALPGGEGRSGLAPIRRAVPQLHAADPGRRGDRFAGDQGVEHRRCCSLRITVLNAVVSLRQEGKAESAMNALKAMVKATARVRRDGSEAEIPGRGAGRRRRRPARRRGRGPRGRPDHRRERPADRRVRIDGRERARVEGGRDAGRHRPRPRRSDRHGVHAHAGHARQRDDDRHRDGRRHRGRQDRRNARDHGQGADAAHQAAQHADPVDRCGGGTDDGRDVRARRAARPGRRRSCSRARSRWRSRRSPRRCRRCCR